MLTWVKQSSSISIAGKLKSNLMLKMTEIRKTLVSFVDFVKTKKIFDFIGVKLYKKPGLVH